MDFARRVWTRIEPVHAVTYFHAATVEAGAALGLKGFWSTYFAFRAAPLGPAPAGVVEALFANFEPGFLRRRVPRVWDGADTGMLLAARLGSAAAAVRGNAPGGAIPDPEVLRLLEDAAAAADPLGKPLFAANRDLDLTADPFERLWQLCTTLREHRGDAHVCALAVAGVDGCESHVLLSAYRGVAPEWLQKARGWSPEQWEEAAGRLRGRGLLDASGALTGDGAALRDGIETRTDEMAASAYTGLTPSQQALLLDRLRPLALAIAAAVLPFPNPIGVPPPE